MVSIYDRYDAQLDTQGLIFYEGGDAQPSTVTLPLRPVRQDTGNNPNEVRPESGDVFSQEDFSYGSGQDNFHGPSSDPEAQARKFYASDGFDISTPGRLKHLYRMQQAFTPTTGATAIAIADSLPFVADGTVVKRGNGSFPGTWTDEDPHAGEAATTVQDLCSKGEEMFAALAANGIHIRSSAGVWSHYQISATNVNVGAAYRLAWVKDRLMAIGSGGGTQRSIYEVVTAAPTAIESLPEGWTFEDIFEAGPYIYATAVNTTGGMSRIHHYGLNSAGTAIEKKGSTPMPDGQLAYCGTGYLSQVYIGGARINSSDGQEPIVYTGIPSEDGHLTLVKLLEPSGASGSASDHRCKAIIPRGESVLFGWTVNSAASPLIEGRAGVATHYLARDAVAFSYKREGSTATNLVNSLAIYEGRLLMTLAGATLGLWYEDIGVYTATAKLVTSMASWNNAGQKSWSRVQLSTKALPSGSSIDLDYSLKHPEEDSWTDTGSDHSTADSTSYETTLTNVNSRRFALRFTSSAVAAGTSAPEILSYSVRSDPKPETTEYRLTRYVLLNDKLRKDDQAGPVFDNPNTIREWLQDKAYSWVTFYENEATWTVRVTEVGDFEPSQPIVDLATGDPLGDAFVMRLTMEGRRG